MFEIGKEVDNSSVYLLLAGPYFHSDSDVCITQRQSSMDQSSHGLFVVSVTRYNITVFHHDALEYRSKFVFQNCEKSFHIFKLLQNGDMISKFHS